MATASRVCVHLFSRLFTFLKQQTRAEITASREASAMTGATVHGSVPLPFLIREWTGQMSSGLLVDRNCASLPLPKLFPVVGKPRFLIHKLDSSPINSMNQPRWDCFWYQGLAQDAQEGDALHFKPMGTSSKTIRGMRIDTYCWCIKPTMKLALVSAILFGTVILWVVIFFRYIISLVRPKKR